MTAPAGDHYDVAVVGYGPTGQALAATLGSSGHRVVVFERHPELYGLPRAGHVDHEIMRVLQGLGCAQRLVDDDAVPIRKYVWLNAEGRDLMVMDWDKKEVSGWDSDYMLWQPHLERGLDDAVRAQPTVEVHQGWEAVALRLATQEVELDVQDIERDEAGRRVGGRKKRTVRATYLVGCDGSNGFVRDALGVEREDYGFNERWLVVDTEPTRPLSDGAGRVGTREITFGLDVFQLCDPARPRYLAPLGRRRRRFEWSLLAGERREEMERPQAAYALLAEWGVTPDDVAIVRQVVYTFEAKLAARFRSGNAFLAGDAAHSMPPYMGQGMCTGIRDAKALAWKLDLVLRGIAPDALLDTYEAERKPNALGWVALSVAVGKVSATLDADAAADRDAAFFRGEPPEIPPLPTLAGGVLAAGADGRPRAPAGTLGPQGVVRRGDRVGLFDDLYGCAGFCVLSVAGDPVAVLDDDDLRYLDRLPTTLAYVTAAADLDGVYASWFVEREVVAVIVRPDFHVFGGVTRLDDLPALVAELRQRIGDEKGEEVTGRK